MDCLQKMTTWIYNNKSIFNGYTFYAHNVGRYNLPLAIKKAFIESPEFIIEGDGCVELNNAWIGFALVKFFLKYFSFSLLLFCKLVFYFS